MTLEKFATNIENTLEKIEAFELKQEDMGIVDEVVDIEEIDSSISITDLGLNDFRMDLLEYIEKKGDINDVSLGMHTVCSNYMFLYWTY